MVKSEQVLLGAGLLGLAYLYLNKSATLSPGGGNGANPPGFDETEGGTRSSITPKEFASWAERQSYFLNLPESERPLSYFTGEPIDPRQPAGSPANPLSPLKPFGAIISWEEWYDIRNVQSTGISKTEFVAKAKGWHLGYTLELIRTRGQGGAIQVYDSDFEDYFGADWRLWQQALGYGGTADAAFDDSGNYMPDGARVYDFPIDNPGYQSWISAGNFGGYYDWLATGKDSGYAAYKAANPGGMDYHQWQTANRPNYTVYRTPDGGYTDYWNGQYYTDWLETDNPLLGSVGSGGGTNLSVEIADVAVSKATAQRGETVVISVTVSNPNSTSKSFSVQFSGELTNATINGTLAGLETKIYSFNRNVNFEGTKSATLGGCTISITGIVETGSMPVEISNLRVAVEEANQGERVDISYDVFNPNNVAVNWNAQFSGTLTTVYKSGILEPNETQTITVSRLINFEGTKSATLAGMTVSITGIPEATYEPPSTPKEPVKDVDYYASVSPWGTSWCCMVCNTCFTTESEVKQHIKNTGHYA